MSEEAPTNNPKESSILEMTRDLLPTQTQMNDDAEDEGVDWNWGKEDDGMEKPIESDGTASMTDEDENPADDDDDDDDKTVALESDHEEADKQPKSLMDYDDQDSSEDEESPVETSTQEEEDVELELEGTQSPSKEVENTPTIEAAEESPSLRRSRRTPKPKKVDEEEEEPKADKSSNKKKKKKKKKKDTKRDDSDQPDHDELLQSTENLFAEVVDKDSVTLKHMYESLEAEYDCKINKATKKVVKEHLTALMRKLQEEQEEGEEEEEEEEDDVSEQGDVEEEEASEYEAEDEEEEEEAPKKKRNKKKKKAKSSSKKKAKAPKIKRPNQRKAAKAARLVEAMRLRKKRMEELRIRNEEMQLNQSKEDQERAEKIAAKLETDTDELRIKRLEDRLDLLGKLDQKRIQVLEDVKAKPSTEEESTSPATPIKAQPEEQSESEDESSDDDDLVIVGATKPMPKPLAPLQHLVSSKALSLLQQIQSPDAKRHRKKQRSATSPTRNMGARIALRNALKQKQRKVGNRWLARELGYKTEEEHLKECQAAADQKRGQTMQREQVRVKANERKQLRERLLWQEEVVPEEDAENEEQTNTSADGEEEEDEEVRMAMEIEKEEAESSQIHNPEETVADTDSVEKKESPAVPDIVASPPEEAIPVASPTTEELEEEEPSTPDFAEDNEEESTPALETQPPPVQAEGEKSLKLFDMEPREVTNETPDDEAKESSEKETLSTEDNETSITSNTAVVDANDASQSEDHKETTKSDDDEEEEEELEFVDEPSKDQPSKDATKSDKPRNAAWQSMLQKEAEKLKKQKKRKNALVEHEAEEEEEEEIAGLEDFGFSIKKKKTGDDEEEDPNSLEVNEDDLKHVVDDVSDGEGDEEAGRMARKRLEQREEKEQHKEMIRRMRDGYDGHRRGIARAGARGNLSFEQLIAADNRDEARRLGLMNDEEFDSDDEREGGEKKGDDEEEDETALLDKYLKDRFLHRHNVELDEDFSEDEDSNLQEDQDKENGAENDAEAEEERRQEQLAKRFAKRARMGRLEETYADSQEFSQQRMIDEDASMRMELKQMKVSETWLLNMFLHKIMYISDPYFLLLVWPFSKAKCFVVKKFFLFG